LGREGAWGAEEGQKTLGAWSTGQEESETGTQAARLTDWALGLGPREDLAFYSEGDEKLLEGQRSREIRSDLLFSSFYLFYLKKKFIGV